MYFKKYFLFLFFTQMFLICSAQTPTYDQKLYYTCKVWGFVKYFHSNVSVCGVNWDSVLVARLPSIKNAVTKNDFNNALDTLLNAAGAMTLATTPRADTMQAPLKRNLNFSWINDTILRADIQTILDTIRNNFRPHGECWVRNNTNYTVPNQGYLVFPRDSLMSATDTYSNYPDEWHRLLLVCRYWNIVNYFNPYNYVLDSTWDRSLYHNIRLLANDSTPSSFYLSFLKLATSLNSAHVQGLTWSSNSMFPYAFTPGIILKHIPNQYVVAASLQPGIVKGDVMTAIDGLSMSQWEDSLRPFFSAGNPSVFRRLISPFMLCGLNYGSPIQLTFQDSVGITHTITAVRNYDFYTQWFHSYYPNDTLANVHWKKISCGIGYVNMGQLQVGEESAMYASLKNTPSIIFDIRNYPNGTMWNIANLMFPSSKHFAKDMLPDTSYPGTFHYVYDSLGMNGNPTPYTGRFIILMNEQTQSQAEYSCMILNALPNTIKVGSQTAGADGDVTYFKLTKDIQAGFTSLGISYPNGDSTERIGIVPDSVVYATALGIRHGRDEVLEKALQIALCMTGVESQSRMESTVIAYPNPTTGKFSISIRSLNNGKLNYKIYSPLGKIMDEKQNLTISEAIPLELDISTFDNGIYFMSIQVNGFNQILKVILSR
jgi:carboxyl-terminal processing protease